MERRPDNQRIAELLSRIAEILELQQANPFRVAAYRNASRAILSSDREATELLRSGVAGLHELGIGQSIASVIQEFIQLGRSTMLERLEGETTPEILLTRVPGIGPVLAARIHDELKIDTLEQLETAARDGRLKKVTGFGERRTRLVADLVAAMLGKARGWRLPSRQPFRAHPQLSAQALLEIDEEYRRRAAAGELRRIAPRRLNPTGEAWLPIMHLERDGWAITALFSNTPRAHDLGKTRDWVVLFCEKDGATDRFTVVTETHGPLAGRRVVRGREIESVSFYAAPKRGEHSTAAQSECA